MSKRLFAIMAAVTILAALYASAAQAQTSQAIEVEVPFAFTTNNKSLPAGTYRIRPAGDSRAVWTITDRGSRSARFLLAAGLFGKEGSDVHVTFHRYGDAYFLAGFKTASYEIGLLPSHREKYLMAGRTAVPADVVNIPTGVGGGR